MIIEILKRDLEWWKNARNNKEYKDISQYIDGKISAYKDVIELMEMCEKCEKESE